MQHDPFEDIIRRVAPPGTPTENLLSFGIDTRQQFRSQQGRDPTEEEFRALLDLSPAVSSPPAQQPAPASQPKEVAVATSPTVAPTTAAPAAAAPTTFNIEQVLGQFGGQWSGFDPSGTPGFDWSKIDLSKITGPAADYIRATLAAGFEPQLIQGYVPKPTSRGGGSFGGGVLGGGEASSLPLQERSAEERLRLPTTGTGRKAYSYWDDARKVQVHAPSGQHFELFPGGGIKVVAGLIPYAGTGPPSGPGSREAKEIVAAPSSLFVQPQTAEQLGVPLKQETLAYEPIAGKTIESIGGSVFNPTTGVMEFAEPGETLIKYNDGTVERRKFGAKPGTAVPAGQFGKTAGELGITRGTEIKGPSGEIIRAPTEQQQSLLGGDRPVFYRSKKTGEIKMYRDDEAYRKRFGGPRPTPPSGALEKLQAEQPSLTEGSVGVTPEQFKAAGGRESYPVDALLSNYGLTASPQEFQAAPFQSFEDIYNKLLDKMGVSDFRAARSAYEKQLADVDAKYAEEVKDVDANPWTSESLRTRQVRALRDKYDTERAQLVSRLQLVQGWDDRARDDARFVATTALTQYNREREFQAYQVDRAMRRSDEMFSRGIQLANLGLTREQRQEQVRQFEVNYGLNVARFGEQQRQFELSRQLDIARLKKPSGSPFAAIKGVQGGLFNLATGKWVIPPTPQAPTAPSAQALRTAYGQWVSENPNLGRSAFESKAVQVGLDPKSDFVQNAIAAAPKKEGRELRLGPVRIQLGF